MADFNKAVLYVLTLEDSTLSGVVTRTEGDSGGTTRFGITARWASSAVPSDFFTTDRATALSDAKQYYWRIYWVRICGDDIRDDKLAAQFLSIAVNVGIINAAKLMQGCCGVVQDGVVGASTLSAINAADPILLLSKFNQAAMTNYRRIADLHPGDGKFLTGWLNRVTSIYRFPVPTFEPGVGRIA